MDKFFFDKRFLHVSGAKGINRYIEKYLANTGVHFRFLSSKRVRPFSLFDPIYLSWMIRKSDIRCLLLPSLNLPLFNGKAIIIATVMDFISYDIYKKNIFSLQGLLKRIYYQWFLPWKLQRVAAIITISQYSKQEITTRYKKINPEKIYIAYPGLDDKIFALKSKNLDVLPSKKYFFSMFSKEEIIEHKNIYRVVEAFCEISNEIDNIELVILGALSSATREKLLRLNTASASIRFIVGVSDDELANYYRGAVAFVYPSLMEGFGMPIVEAMACGCPVITSNISSMPEVAGKAALLVDPYNHQEITDAMRKTVSDEKLREKLIAKGVARSKFFSWVQTASAIDNVITNALKVH
jgi:glycosyltransferase involved in cell wall biosynthesis